MPSRTSIAASLLGVFVVATTFANPQERDSNSMVENAASSSLPAHALIKEIQFVGLHRVAAEAAKSRLSIHPGDEFNSTRIAADIHALSRAGWFDDVSAKTVTLDRRAESLDGLQQVQLQFHVREYPYLESVTFNGSNLLSQQQIKKLLDDKKLFPRLGAPADPVKLHRAALAIQSELAATGYPEAQTLVREEELAGQCVKVAFQIRDGPHLPVVRVSFSGHPEISDKVLRKQMRQLSPDSRFSGLRNKNVFTPEKFEADRVNLLTYLQNHGFPQARVGAPQVTLVNAYSSPPSRWRVRPVPPGLTVGLPVESGSFYTFGIAEISPPLRRQLSSASKSELLSPGVAPGRPFSEHAVESLRRDWEIRLHRKLQRQRGTGDYRLRATSSFDRATHKATVRFDFDPTSPYTVHRIEFLGNRRFPDKYLRRRFPLAEGQPLDEYAIEAGLARLARTGYFQPFKSEDVHIDAYESTHTADVTIHLREKGKQRLTFSGGRRQFGNTACVAYIVFDLLGLDEFLSIQFDGGPESLQLALGFAKEGFLGSRGTLAISAFDTFVRPRLTAGVRGPFQRSQTEGFNLGWTYAISDMDAIGLNFGISQSHSETVVSPLQTSADPQPIDLQSKISSHSLGIGWTRDTGNQKIQLTDSASGGWLGGDENLLKSKIEYGQIYPDEIFNHHNSFAFRTTLSGAGSYKGDMPFYARFFSSDDQVRGLRPGELGPYQILSAISPSGATTYSAVPSGANLVTASNLEYRIPITHQLEGATFFDAGSGLPLPNWLGPTRPTLIHSTNGLLHATTGLEFHWILPIVGVPIRFNYSFNLLRLDRVVLRPDGSTFRLHDRLGMLGWGYGFEPRNSEGN